VSDHQSHPGAPTFNIGALSRIVVSDDEHLIASLQGVARAGCALLMNCAAASVTLVEDGRARTIASTNEAAVAIDQAQYDADDGPCLEAARKSVVVRIDWMPKAQRWKNVAARAIDLGVLSSLSLPLVLPGPSTIGAFNVYGALGGAFDEDDEQIGQAFAVQASVVVANAKAYWAAFESTRQLAEAMESRSVIEQAKGILMRSERCTADRAFEILRGASQRQNRKLRDIAAELVARTAGGEA
jgi:GAF domain-containing protein